MGSILEGDFYGSVGADTLFTTGVAVRSLAITITSVDDLDKRNFSLSDDSDPLITDALIVAVDTAVKPVGRKSRGYEGHKGKECE